MTPPLLAALRAGGFVLLAVILCCIASAFAGFSPFDILLNIAEGSVASGYALMESLRWAMPLMISALGVLVAFRCGYFNVGVQGQFYLGAIAADVVAQGLDGAPALVVIPLSLLGGIAGGALWAFWPGWLRLKSRTDEVITTLMGNFLATLLLSYLTSGPLKDSSGSGQVAASPPVAAAYRIANASGVSPEVIGITLVVLVAVWLLVNRTGFGVLSGLAGRNPTMITWQGAPVVALGLSSFLLSGGLAGLAGAVELLGPNGRLVSGFLPGHGFTAVLIALVAGISVPATAVVALFFGGLASASLYLPVIAGLPSAAIDIINAAIALLITAKRLPFPKLGRAAR